MKILLKIWRVYKELPWSGVLIYLVEPETPARTVLISVIIYLLIFFIHFSMLLKNSSIFGELSVVVWKLLPTFWCLFILYLLNDDVASKLHCLLKTSILT